MAPSVGMRKPISTTAAGLLGIIIIVLLSYSPGLLRSSSGGITSLVRRDATIEVLDSDTTSHFAPLARRDDYSCGKGNPCANGACCGKSGYCGYGSTYCGTGCVSNCNATAECGQYASPKGKTCPLNTCCSQYGFCGTTTEFCTDKCQSNCITNPKPPGGGGGGHVLNRVIGYYESWSQRLTCHKINPTDLPLEALTHLNYAFAYIDPQSFNIVTMDGQTPESLFQSTVNVKQYKADLKVWISVGGWTFSDNGTATQKVFGKIASSAANRQTFANNALKFMTHYGFDGIDIDWEYPGAPDRGGTPADTDNYVLLLQTMRSTFNSSPRRLGISFTAPSSYWYLRWFDIPGLLNFADWINFMTYDLHGVWDRNNPIGSIVQAHTNLTEINYALQLLWRVKTPPSKVSMGFGFYGRSFKLASSSCSKPGCQFSGGATPGPCSATSGILYYYEIQAMLKQHPELKPVYDSTAAVKYLVYDNNQWISYDDAQTLQQKVKWANTQGLGGSLIWASDTDDDKYTAHSGLLGRSIAHTDLSTKYFWPSQQSIAQNLIGQNGQDCEIGLECVDFNNPQASSCGSGFTRVGFVNEDECVENLMPLKYMKPICCPAATAPSSCTWRGSGGDCDGQCHVGESSLFRSSWGGRPGESSAADKCSRGGKIFCCTAGDWKGVTDGCSWTDCGGSCKSGTSSVATKDTGFLATCHQQYCCPNPVKLTDCAWQGTLPDCPDAKCSSGQVTIDLDPQGTTAFGCSWGRQKALCCSVKAPPAPPLECDINLCDVPGESCPGDESGIEARDLEKRKKKGGGSPRRYFFTVPALAGRFITSFRYPVRGRLFRGVANVIRQYWRMARRQCQDTTVQEDPIPDTTNLPDGGHGQTEHPVDLDVHEIFIDSLASGHLPSGGQYPGTIPSVGFLINIYTNENYLLPAGLPRVSPTSPDIRSPAGRVFEAMGSTTNRRNFMLVEDQINNAKASLFQLQAVMSDSDYRRYVRQATTGDQTATQNFLQPLRTAIGVFHYLQTYDATTRFQAVRQSMHDQYQIIENNIPGARGITAAFDAFFPDFMTQIENYAQAWVEERIGIAREAFRGASTTPANYQAVMQALLNLENEIYEMLLPR